MYLTSFPEGTNPLFKERTDHDCNCCKQFIRTVGGAVAVIDGKIESIWDISVSEPAYQAVADAMSKYVKSLPIANKFLHYEKHAGTNKTFQQLIADKSSTTCTWEHFFVNIPQQFVVKKDTIATTLGLERAAHDVLYRSLSEITPDAVNTVQELIAQRSLYRGDEHTFVLNSFQKMQTILMIREKLPVMRQTNVFG